MEKHTSPNCNTVTINIAGPVNTGKTVWTHLIIQALLAKGLNVSVTQPTADELAWMSEANVDEIVDQLKDRLQIVINQEHVVVKPKGGE